MFRYLIVNFKYKLQSWEEITWNFKFLELSFWQNRFEFLKKNVEKINYHI